MDSASEREDSSTNLRERRYTTWGERLNRVVNAKEDIIAHDVWYYLNLALYLVPIIIAFISFQLWTTSEPFWMNYIRGAVAVISVIVSLAIQKKSYRRQHPKRYSKTVHFD